MTGSAEAIEPEVQPRKALDHGFITEAEAAKRFCPHQRVTWANKKDDGGFSTTSHPAFNMVQINHIGERHIAARCVASACMSWRWSPNGEGGFCGLAGRPI